jgi:flagellar assembly factor FliW
MYPVHHNKFIVADNIYLSDFHMIYHNWMKSTKKKEVQFLGVEPFIFFNPIGWMNGNTRSPQLT